MPQRANLAAFVTLIVIVAVVIVPAMMLGAALVSEATAVYDRIEGGDFDLGRAFLAAEGRLPAVMQRWLADLGLNDFDALMTRIEK